MLEILLTVLLVLAIVIAGVLAFASTRPDSFRLERSIVVEAPPARVFPLIADFHRWTEWSPWENVDADLKRTYSGSVQGRGAVYEWLGKKTGQGRMEIVEAAEPSLVKIKLDFLKPFEAHNTAEFRLEPVGDGTRVHWAMFGPSNLLTKVIHLFFSMDRMVGKQFEQGLANLKALAER